MSINMHEVSKMHVSFKYQVISFGADLHCNQIFRKKKGDDVPTGSKPPTCLREVSPLNRSHMHMHARSVMPKA